MFSKIRSIICIFFIFLIFLSGCSQNGQAVPGRSQAGTQQSTDDKTSDPSHKPGESTENSAGNSSSDKPDENSSPSSGDSGNMLKPDMLKLPEGSYASIDSLLKGYGNVQYGWSNNKEYAAFNLTDQVEKEDAPVLYIWKVGEGEPSVVEGVGWLGFGGFYWSPDDSCLIFDSGTSHARSGDICWVQGLTAMESIGYVGRPVWSPDSRWVAVGAHKPVQTVVDTSLEGSSDIWIYNVETKEKRLVGEGAPEYYLTPKSWDKDGALTYEKHYFTDGNKAEDVTVKPDTDSSPPITHEDQRQVEQLICSYYKALEDKDYDAAAQCLAYQGRMHYENSRPKSAMWESIKSVKLVSLEGCLPPNVTEDESKAEVPTVYFNVNLDIVYNPHYSMPWKDGVCRYFVNVVKEDGEWKIYYDRRLK